MGKNWQSCEKNDFTSFKKEKESIIADDDRE